MKLMERTGDVGVAEVDGVRARVMLALVPSVKVGDFVVVHAGYALSIVDEDEAQRTLDLLQQVWESGN
jgi:hydrogenase expression/formation protein HypC